MLNNITNPKKTGNKCGHDPKGPRYFVPPAKHLARPKLLKIITERIKRYFADPRTLPTLNAANQSKRQQRSERREACIALLACIIHYTDIMTLRVGIPQADGSMQGLTMPFLAELSGLGERRAERAIRDLKAAGILSVHPICEKIGEATYKGIAAIRAISAKLFTVLGLGAWLQHERKRAAARHAEKAAKRAAKRAANVAMAMGAQFGPKPPAPLSEQRKKGMTSISEFLSTIRQSLKT